MPDFSGYKGKKVLVTGHTGFKGTWLCKELLLAGAKVIGVSVDVPTTPSLYEASGISGVITDLRLDIRDFDSMLEIFKQYRPEMVFHLAAQALVREGYENPRETYETNLMGTVNVLECIRRTPSVKTFINVTTDKVYANSEEGILSETDVLDGMDPYSNSKSCSELATWTYWRSFPELKSLGFATLRAGNTIGGGDFGENRIIPDCIKAARASQVLEVRNPRGNRPYQHVLDAVDAYLEIGLKLEDNPELSGAYNIGPAYGSTTTEDLVNLFKEVWEEKTGEGFQWKAGEQPEVIKETEKLELDCSLAEKTFGLKLETPLKKAVEDAVNFIIDMDKE